MPESKIQVLEEQLKNLRSKSDTGASGRKKADTLIKLAHVLYSADPKKSENYAKEASALARKLNYRKGIANSYLVMGHSFCTRNDYDKAIGCYRKSLKIRKEMGDKRGIANSYLSIGVIYDTQSDFNNSLQYLFKALKMFEEIRDKRGIAKSCNNIGLIYVKQGDHNQGLTHLLKASKVLEQIDNKEGVAASLSNIGIIYAERNDYDQASVYFEKALKIYKEIGHKIGIGSCYNNIGLNYEAQGDYRQALEHHLKALKISREIGNKNSIASSYGSIGRIQTKSKHFGSALSYLQKCLRLTQEIGEKHKVTITYKNLSELYEAQKNYNKALRYYKKYTEVEKAIFNAEKSKQIAEMHAKYETEKKEKEAEVYHLKNVKLRKEIRERKKAEKELKKHREHLEKLVAERTKQLRSLAHELSLVEEKQRRKIATYLHDDVAQALALATVRLELLRDVVPKKNIKKELEAIKEMIDQTTARTRSLTFEISPPVLYDSGFEPAVEWLAEQFQNKHNIICELKTDGLPKPVSGDTKVILFQSVRELLTNVAKHAQARTVRVLTQKKGNTISIEVRDDGVGFNSKILSRKITKNEGFGIFNLKERLRHLHGKLEISSKVGQGTSVTIMAPLKPSARGANRKRKRI